MEGAIDGATEAGVPALALRVCPKAGDQAPLSLPLSCEGDNKIPGGVGEEPRRAY